MNFYVSVTLTASGCTCWQWPSCPCAAPSCGLTWWLGEMVLTSRHLTLTLTLAQDLVSLVQ